MLQSAAYLLVLSVSLLSAAANGLGLEPPTCEKGFAIEMSIVRLEPLLDDKVVDDEVWASLVFLATVDSLPKRSASTSTWRSSALQRVPSHSALQHHDIA